jgi:hypothetical protein
MTSPKELRTAYGLALILLVVGIVCYAATPLSPPKTPLRMVFPTVAGSVWFDHQTHTSATGYGLACGDCHHHPQDADDTRACGSCHAAPAQAEAVKGVCIECHDEDEIDLDALPGRGDAFHQQCIRCHKEFQAGPAECAACHVIQ